VRVWMCFVFYLAASRTGITTINRRAAGLDRIPAIERFGQGAGQRFELVEVVAGEKIGVAEASPGEGALEQSHALGVAGELFEGHAQTALPNQGSDSSLRKEDYFNCGDAEPGAGKGFRTRHPKRQARRPRFWSKSCGLQTAIRHIGVQAGNRFIVDEY
jgi:hypothetical protein